MIAWLIWRDCLVGWEAYRIILTWMLSNGKSIAAKCVRKWMARDEWIPWMMSSDV